VSHRRSPSRVRGGDPGRPAGHRGSPRPPRRPRLADHGAGRRPRPLRPAAALRDRERRRLRRVHGRRRPHRDLHRRPQRRLARASGDVARARRRRPHVRVDRADDHEPHPDARRPTPVPDPDRPATRRPAAPAVPRAPAATKAPSSSASYANCAAVRAAGAAPISAGQPGYSRKLDRDGDGGGLRVTARGGGVRAAGA